MIKENQRHLNRIGLVLDIIVLLFAMILAWWIRFVSGWVYAVDAQYIQIRNYIVPAIIMIPVYISIYGFLKLYVPKRIRAFYKEIGSIIQANIIGMLIFTMMLFVFKQDNYSRMLLFIFALANTILMILERLGIRIFIRTLRKKGYNKKHILLLGYNPLAEEFLTKLTANKYLGYNLIGVLDESIKKRSENCNEKLIAKAGGQPLSTDSDDHHGEWVGDLERLEEYLGIFQVDEIFIALKTSQYERIGKILRLAEKQGIRANIIPDYYRYIPSKPYIEDLDGIPIINTRYIPLDHLGNRTIKRILDICLSLMAIIVTSPLMLFSAIFIKITSKGPIIFRQERVGLNKKAFMMYKFRSMRVQLEEEEKAEWTTQNDPRKTKFGTWIRKTSIDELPQFFNVLKGDMSIVGPRPERPYFVEQFKEEIPKYMIKHHVRPGITGWAQVNGWRGDTSIEKRIECDIYYIENWNIGLDIKIMCLTVFKGFINKNAY